MRKPLVRVLVVDDFAPARTLIRQMLRSMPELEVVGEATNGLEAVEKARDWEPQLILLDIGLPILNGIEAAKQIRHFSPHSKILFVSETYSADVAAEALNAGGLGYVIKSDAGSDLLKAVETVIQGGQFVSARLTGRVPAAVANPQALDRRRVRETLESFSARLPRSSARCHEVQFYSDEKILMDRISRCVGATLTDGGAVVAFATDLHRNSFIDGLQDYGLDVRAAMERGTYRIVDVSEAISTFMLDGRVNPAKYLEGMADLLDSSLRTAESKHPRVLAYGELAVPLLAQGNTDAVIQIEQLSDEFAREYGLDILCTYPTMNLRVKDSPQVLQRIRDEHSAVYS